jgi:DNA-binding GntR family transcriptional regulator
MESRNIQIAAGASRKADVTHAGLVPMIKTTLQDRIYDELRYALMRGQFRPGEVLTIRTLAGALGTSIVPVRDALQRLMAERALEILPNRSARVPLTDREEFDELTSIRIALEGLAVEAAPTRLSKGDIHRMEHLNAQMNEAILKGDGAGILESNMAFHFTIYRIAARPLLFGIIESLWVRIGPLLVVPMRHLAAKDVVFGGGINRHREVIAALRVGDGKRARLEIEADIAEAAEWYRSNYDFVSEARPRKF